MIFDSKSAILQSSFQSDITNPSHIQDKINFTIIVCGAYRLSLRVGVIIARAAIEEKCSVKDLAWPMNSYNCELTQITCVLDIFFHFVYNALVL